jgi:hypothetical protein
LKDIVVPLENSEGADNAYALLGSYLLQISRATDEVRIWRGRDWHRFALTGAEVLALEETILLTAPAIGSLIR